MRCIQFNAYTYLLGHFKVGGPDAVLLATVLLS
jgi:hypothetical protein